MNRVRRRLWIAALVAAVIAPMILVYSCETGVKQNLAFEREYNINPRIGIDSNSVCGCRLTRPEFAKSYVVQRKNPKADWNVDCASCVEDYRRFIKKARKYSRKQTRETTMDLVDKAVDGWTHLKPIVRDPLKLSEIVRKALGTGFLYENLDKRPQLVEVAEVIREFSYTESHLIFRDPWVGSFPAILRVPNDLTEPAPAVILIHGHGESAEGVYYNHRFQELTDQRIITIAPTMRANFADGNETEIALELLDNGFSLLGLRIYETLLVRKYLRALQCVDPEHIALVGHSGGSVNNNVLMRIDSDFAAYVFDATGLYNGLYQKRCTDETVPALYPYHRSISDPKTFSLPYHQAPYDFEGDYEVIFRFLNEHLRKTESKK